MGFTVPRMLSNVQKTDRAETSASFLSLFNENPHNFISRFLTVDEIWLHHFDPGRKVQSKLWFGNKSLLHLKCRKFRVVMLARKVMGRCILGF